MESVGTVSKDSLFSFDDQFTLNKDYVAFLLLIVFDSNCLLCAFALMGK